MKQQRIRSYYPVVYVLILFLFLGILLKNSTAQEEQLNSPTETKQASLQFIVNYDYLTVGEGGSANLSVLLSAEPPKDVTAWANRISGDSDLNIQAGAIPVSILKTEWNIPHIVTFTAAEDPDTIDGTAVFRMRDTSGAGIPNLDITARELDNDNVMDVGGTIPGNTIWDASHNYRITSTIIIPAGIQLTIPAGVSITQSGSFRAFEVSGSLNATDDYFLLNTYTDWDNGDRPDQRQNAVNLLGNAQAVLKRCIFHSNEYSNNYYQFYDDWSAIIHATETSQLTVEGCSFQTLNQYNGWRTTFGVMMESPAGAHIRDDTSTGNTIKTSFKGFPSGIGWAFGSAMSDVSACSFTSCDANVRVWGNVENAVTLNNANQQMGGGIYVQAGGTLTLSPGSEIRSSGASLDFHVYGILQATKAALSLDTWTDWDNGDYPNQRHHAIYFFAGSKGTFDKCVLTSDERRDHSIHYYDDWSALLYCQGNSQLFVRGCSLESLNRISPSWRTSFGIYVSPETQASMGDYIEGSNTYRTSFKGFVTGTFWNFGAGNAQIVNCQYSDIFSNIRIVGDVTHHTTLPVDSMHTLGNITIKSGAKLTFPQGSSLVSSPSSYVLTVESGGRMDALNAVLTMGHPMKISGTLDCRNTTMTLDTYTDWDGGDHPEQRLNGIDVLDGASAYFTSCVLKSIEKRDHSIHYYDDWSAIINAEGSSLLVVDGCSFESLNSANPNWWTSFGVRLTGGVNTYMTDYSGDPSIHNSFKNFHSGIEWEFGSEVQRVAKSDFSGCDINVRLVGDISRILTFKNTRQVMASPISIQSGGMMNLTDGSELFNAGNRLTVSAGTIQATQTSFELNTLTNWDAGDHPEQRWNGMDIIDQGIATFDRCAFRSYEGQAHSIHYFNDWSAIINAEGNANLTVKGCSFESMNTVNPSWWTIFGIRLAGDVTVWIGDSTSPGPAVKTSFESFRSAMNLTFGSTGPQIKSCEFQNCGLQIRVDGSLTGELTLPEDSLVSQGGPIAIKTGGHLTLSQGSNFESLDNIINVEGDGIFEAVDTILWLQTRRNQGNWSLRNQFYFSGASSGIFTNCALYEREMSAGDQEDCVMFLSDTSNLALDGCLLTQHPDYPSAPYPYHYIWSETEGNLTIENSAFLNTKATGLIIKTNFPSSTHVTNNHFEGNSYAINNHVATTLPARYNWWGAPTGPTHSGNPGGTGDRVSNYVDYGDYLLDSPCPSVSLLDPVTGQEIDNFGSSAAQNNVELIGFRVEPASSEIRQIGFRIYEVSGISWSDIANFRLVKDANANGTIDPGETQTVGRVPILQQNPSDLIITFSDFVSSSNINVDYILVADFTNLMDDDSLKIEAHARSLKIANGYIPRLLLSPSFHYVGAKLVLANPVTYQEPDNLSGLADQAGVELLGFRLLGSSRTVDAITFNLSDVSGMSAENFSSLKLVVDSNKNGMVDAGEAKVGGTGALTLSGSTGTIEFVNNFFSQDSYILMGDFTGLVPGSKLTVNLSASGIALLGAESVLGSVSPATHIVDSPYILAESHYWVKPENFGETAAQIKFPVLGFILFPGGRQVTSLTIRISGILGILPDDFSNFRLWWDRDGDGSVDAGDSLLDTGVIHIDGSDGYVEFTGGFITRGDLIVTADFGDLEDYDEFTVSMSSQDVIVPPGNLVLGSGPTVRHAVKGGIPDNVGANQNWTLVYRSPGGYSVNGRFNHAGNLLILGYDTGSAWVYDSQSNTPLLMLKEHYDKVMYAGFNSDDTAAVTVTRDGAVFIWDLENGSKRSEMFSDLLVTSAIPSPDFRKLMVITEGKGLLLDIDLNKRLWEFIPGAATVNSIAYSPDGKYIAIGSSDKRAYIMDAETGVEVTRFLGHTQTVTAVGFTADGKYLMTSSTDATAQLWDIEAHKVVNTIELQGQSSQTAAVSDDGLRVAMITGSGNSALLRMFDEEGLELFSVNIAVESGYIWEGTVVTLTFDDAGERVLVTSTGSWAPAACFRSDNGDFVRHWGPLGSFPDNYNMRPRISGDGEKIFYMSSWGLDLLPRQPGKPILRNESIGAHGYDISADGSKLIWMNSNNLYMDNVTETGFTRLATHFVGFTYYTITASHSGSMVIAGDRLLSTLTGLVMADYAIPNGEYRGAFSPDQRLWGFAVPNDKSIITMQTNDPRALLYNMMDTSPNTPYKMFYHPDDVRVGCADNVHSQNQGVQMFDMNTYLPVGLYRFQNSADACLSKDGTMLLIGGNNEVQLFDVKTGRILRYFFPQHSGLTSVRVRSVQFSQDDTMIMIAWSANYIELYQRSKALNLEISPASRTLASGQDQAFNVEVLYDDTTRYNVSPSLDALPGEAILTVIPETAGTFHGNVLTVSPGVSGIFIVQAQYREGNRTFTAESIISVGASHVVRLNAKPERMTVTPGIFRSIQYTATFDDGYETDVTDQVTMSCDKMDDVVFSGKTVKVLFTADPGTLIIKGEYTDRYGTKKTAQTELTSFGPKTQWVRYRVTGGGYGLSADFSPDGHKLATGSSSGAINIYDVGLTPSQYSLENVIIAHEGMVNYLAYLSNSQFITTSDEGTIKLWDAADPTSIPLTVYHHSAPITAAQISSDKLNLVFGDSEGNVAMYNIAANNLDWTKPLHESQVNAVALDNMYVISGGKDKRAKFLVRANGDLLKNILTHTRPIVGVGFLGPDGFFIASGDKTVSFWRRSDLEILDRYEFGSVPTVSAVMGGQLYIGMENPASTYVFNSDHLLLRWLEHPPSRGRITRLLIDPSGNYILTGRGPRVSEVEDFLGMQGRKIETFSAFQFWETGRAIFRGSLAHSFPLIDAHPSHDAGKIYSQDHKRTIVWEFADSIDVSEKRLMETGYFIDPHFDGMDATQDDSILATRVGVSIYMYDTAQDILWKTLHNPGGECAFAISPNATRMATGDALKVRLWDLIGLTQIRAESRKVEALDFRLNDHFLGSIYSDKFVGIWNNMGLLSNGMETAYSPKNVFVNSTGERASVVTELILESLFGTSHLYYLEIFDVSNIGIEPPLVNRVFLLEITKDLFGAGEDIPDFDIAVSDDTAMALVAATGDHPVKLINLNDGSTIKEFFPPSHGARQSNGAAAVEFADNDDSVMIAWSEGYAELYHRVPPVALDVTVDTTGTLGGDFSDKTALEFASRQKNDGIPVRPGQPLRIYAIATFENKETMNVTASVKIIPDVPDKIWLSGSHVIIKPDALPGPVVLTVKYEEPNVTLQEQVTLDIGPRVVDQNILKYYLLGMVQLKSEELDAADANNDEKIDISDMITFMK